MKYFIFVLLFVFSMGLLVGCPPPKGDKADANAPMVTKEKVPEAVKTVTIEQQLIPRNVTYSTTLLPIDEVYLASAAPGRIEKIYVEVGAEVKKGQVLVQMDRTQLHQAEIQLQNLQADLERLETLKRAGSVPLQQYDQVRTQYDVATANLEFLKDNTQLLSPFTGMITGKYYEDGEMFSGAPNTTVGKAAIVTIAAIDTMKARVAVSEMYYPHISTKTKLHLTTDVYSDKTFSGQVLRVFPSIDPNSRTFIAEVKVPNQDKILRPGMSARVHITLDQIKALMIPASAILKLRGSNERFIFLEKDGAAKRVTVKLGERYNEMVEILSQDVSPGDQLIVAGQNRLLDGDRVSVQN